MKFSPVIRDADHFQQSPSPEQLVALCQAAFGGATEVEAITELNSGLFNNCYLVELRNHPKLILRIAPGPSAHVFPNERNLMRREYAVQPFLVPACPTAPRTVAADFTRRLIERDYVFQSYIEGEVWGSLHEVLSVEEKDAIRRQLGGVARRINNVVGTAFGFPHPEPAFSRWSDFLLYFLTGMLDELRRLGSSTGGAERLVQWIEDHRALFDQITEPRLLHGDLWPQNVLIRRTAEGPEIVGILDSERVIWGDPLFEWTYHLGTTHPAYWEGYGPRDQSPEASLRALAYKGIWLVLVLMEHHRFHSDVSGAYAQMSEVIATLPK